MTWMTLKRGGYERYVNVNSSLQCFVRAWPSFVLGAMGVRFHLHARFSVPANKVCPELERKHEDDHEDDHEDVQPKENKPAIALLYLT